jgi:hypothetical protein
MFVVLLLIGDHQTYKVSENLIGKGGEVFPGVPDGPNPPNFGRTSPWLFTNLQKSASKRTTKMPKITLDNLQKSVRIVQKFIK